MIPEPDRDVLARLTALLGGEIAAGDCIICPAPEVEPQDRRLLIRLLGDTEFVVAGAAGRVLTMAEWKDARLHVSLALEAVRFEQAAAEAREASRRYWAKGGPADRKYPVLSSAAWPEEPARPSGTAIQDIRDRQRRRRR